MLETRWATAHPKMSAGLRDRLRPLRHNHRLNNHLANGECISGLMAAEVREEAVRTCSFDLVEQSEMATARRHNRRDLEKQSRNEKHEGQNENGRHD